MVHRIVYLCITIRNGYDIWPTLFETLFIFGIDGILWGNDGFSINYLLNGQ